MTYYLVMEESVKHEDVLYEVDGPAAVITINREERLNAFRGQTIEELIHAFKRGSEPGGPVHPGRIRVWQGEGQWRHPRTQPRYSAHCAWAGTWLRYAAATAPAARSLRPRPCRIGRATPCRCASSGLRTSCGSRPRSSCASWHAISTWTPARSAASRAAARTSSTSRPRT